MTITIKKAEKSDIPDIARIHVASKRKAYEGIVSQNFLDSKNHQEYIDKWNQWFDEDDIQVSIVCKDGDALGFISYGGMQTPPPGTSKIRPQYTAEIFAIHIHPDCWREGFGEKLIRHATDVLKEQKHKSLCLWVLAKNERATKFYDYLKGQRIGKRMIEVGPNKIKELCYGWRDINVILEKA